MCLATLHVTKARDETGREIEPKYEVTDSVVWLVLYTIFYLICYFSYINISHPKPFPYTISPRSMKARDLILLVEDEVEDMQSDAAALSNIHLDM